MLRGYRPHLCTSLMSSILLSTMRLRVHLCPTPDLLCILSPFSLYFHASKTPRNLTCPTRSAQHFRASVPHYVGYTCASATSHNLVASHELPAGRTHCFAVAALDKKCTAAARCRRTSLLYLCLQGRRPCVASCFTTDPEVDVLLGLGIAC